MNGAGMEMTADRVPARGIAAVIATNPPVSREGVGPLPASREPGGLSGAPLKALATAVVGRLRRQLPASVAAIAAGGLPTPAGARGNVDSRGDHAPLSNGPVYPWPGLAVGRGAGLPCHV